MPAPAVLLVADDPSFVGFVRREIESIGPFEFRHVAGVEGAQADVTTGTPDVILIHANPAVEFVQVAHLLWLIADRGRSTPVLILNDRYDVDQATLLFGLGVADYLSLETHLDQIAPVVKALLTTDSRAPEPEPAATPHAPRMALQLREILESLL